MTRLANPNRRRKARPGITFIDVTSKTSPVMATRLFQFAFAGYAMRTS